MASLAWGQDQEPEGTFIEGQPIPAARQREGPPAVEDNGIDDAAEPVRNVADPLPPALDADELMPALERIEAAIRGLNTPVEDEERARQERDLRAATIIYKNSGRSPAVLKRISPIASTIPATAEPEPLNPFYFNRDLFLEMEASHLEPGQATKEIVVSCSLPKRLRELAAAQGIGFSLLTEDTAKVVLQDRITYTDLLGNETVLYVRYHYVLGFFELIQIHEERPGFRENAERVGQARPGAVPA